MSVRTWDAGNQNWVLFIFYVLLALLVLLGTAQTNWQLDLPVIVGLVFMILILATWIAFFIRVRRSKIRV
jgi:hypothetical protein